MCTTWAGIIGIEIRNVSKIASQQNRVETLRAVCDMVENDFVEHWRMFNEKTKARTDIPLSQKLLSFAPPEAMWVVNHYPQVAADPRMFWGTLMAAVHRASTHTSAEIVEAQREMRKVNSAIPRPD